MIRTWWRPRVQPRSTPSPRNRGGRRKPAVEVLEDRTLPSFIAPATYAAGPQPDALAVGDFNHDGIVDLVTANFTDYSVSVLLGNPDGSFRPPTRYAAGNFPTSVAVGDFNGDGILDLAVTDSGTNPTYADGGVSVLLGTGDGTFQAPIVYAAGTF